MCISDVGFRQCGSIGGWDSAERTAVGFANCEAEEVRRRDAGEAMRAGYA